MTAANVKIFNTEEVQNFINLLSGLEQEGGNPRIKQIIHRVVSDLFKTIEDLEITDLDNAETGDFIVLKNKLSYFL